MLKYSLGLDISAKEIHCCLSTIDRNQKVVVKASRKVANNIKGFRDLQEWVTRHRKKQEIPLARFIHEYENRVPFSGLGFFSGQFSEKVT